MCVVDGWRSGIDSANNAAGCVVVDHVSGPDDCAFDFECGGCRGISVGGSRSSGSVQLCGNCASSRPDGCEAKGSPPRGARPRYSGEPGGGRS